MPYEPREDSYLLQEQVSIHAKGKVLEIGTGSGIQALSAAENHDVDSVLAVDIDPEVIAYCKQHAEHAKILYAESNLFSSVKGKFDTIIFNPPYLPYDPDEPSDSALATSGGKKGYELTEQFLNEANNYLTDDGIILLLFSTLTKKERVHEFLHNNLFDFEQVASQKVSFEELLVYKITKNRFRKELEKHGVTNIKPLTHGHRGLIFTGTYKDKKISIKMQRQDIGATGTVDNEIRQLKVLNKHGIGPHLLFYGVDYFTYDFIRGDFILNYFAKPTTTRTEVIRILTDVLNQMRTLDKLCLNKEEMHHPTKHILIDEFKKPILIDFERCKPKDKLHNVTQFVQFIVSGHVAPTFQRFKIDVDKQKILDTAKAYAENMDDDNFKKVAGLIR